MAGLHCQCPQSSMSQVRPVSLTIPAKRHAPEWNQRDPSSLASLREPRVHSALTTNPSEGSWVPWVRNKEYWQRLTASPPTGWH